MKTPWIILILTLPILGVALYFLIGLNGGTWKMRMRYKRLMRSFCLFCRRTKKYCNV